MNTSIMNKTGIFLLMVFLSIANLAMLASATDASATADQNAITNGIGCILCKVAQLIFMVVAGLAALIVIIAGVRWLTSGDDPGARTAAKNTIVSAFVGIIIIFIAVYVVAYVVSGVITIPGGINPSSWFTGCACSPTTMGANTGSGASSAVGPAVVP